MERRQFLACSYFFSCSQSLHLFFSFFTYACTKTHTHIPYTHWGFCYPPLHSKTYFVQCLLLLRIACIGLASTSLPLSLQSPFMSIHISWQLSSFSSSPVEFWGCDSVSTSFSRFNERRLHVGGDVGARALRRRRHHLVFFFFFAVKQQRLFRKTGGGGGKAPPRRAAAQPGLFFADVGDDRGKKFRSALK